MESIKILEENIYAGQMTSVKTEFVVEGKVFTYSYLQTGVVAIAKNNSKLPEVLLKQNAYVENEAEILMETIQKLVETKKTILIPKEKRLKLTSDFKGSYIRYEYGFEIVCLSNDQVGFIVDKEKIAINKMEYYILNVNYDSDLDIHILSLAPIQK